ncbi:15002_t:CDS:2 [Cetraspora pellucida]|uniref:15002_t:CDS:1 n=1 Tax=Cetraspora pellucida TaxID=1433469 RepID=A0A9N9BX52_9GLOM|nr:15002_t:CDS:2 [Cetraspora pellucida]
MWINSNLPKFTNEVQSSIPGQLSKVNTPLYFPIFVSDQYNKRCP